MGSEISLSRPERVQAICTLIPVVLCLPEYNSGEEAHDQQGSRVPSTMYCVSRSRSSAVGIYPSSAFPINGVNLVMARLIVDWDTPYVSASSACTRFRRIYVSATTTDLYMPRMGGHGDFWSIV